MKHPAISADEAAKRLQDEEKRLLRDLSDIADEDQNNPGTYLPKPPELDSETDDDISIDATIAAESAAVIEQLQEDLRDVRKAQAALKAGTYGICKYCQNPIDPKRLEARPASSSCVACKKTLTQEL